MCIAGLWEQWRNPGTGDTVHSVTILTINSDNHPFIRYYHKPEDEKRMV
jgi:putative SOS response-associated peptidase YedK